ncbi:MAG: hypothetical protein COV10_02595 [Candidatus Vogelbacteria bacterium CG10_big_fil_rev_8_21_14_0_10_51_16]|uniref:Uncharacterized protein n=1 Tax=Candidatus Vogelbacteria bacterium CG10_big_fil_rev_8_21_14_0_10_51_16 TaxID=1975045 RepID=A0A2H0RDY6_9BACT|nr:MAG: hypothetical protein COV10_02595 [Candidatus Vogelbacteria bacterium CG10_big_fil_rev_8_21_14_0_10_51_16]
MINNLFSVSVQLFRCEGELGKTIVGSTFPGTILDCLAVRSGVLSNGYVPMTRSREGVTARMMEAQND